MTDVASHETYGSPTVKRAMLAAFVFEAWSLITTSISLWGRPHNYWWLITSCISLVVALICLLIAVFAPISVDDV